MAAPSATTSRAPWGGRAVQRDRAADGARGGRRGARRRGRRHRRRPASSAPRRRGPALPSALAEVRRRTSWGRPGRGFSSAGRRRRTRRRRSRRRPRRCAPGWPPPARRRSSSSAPADRRVVRWSRRAVRAPHTGLTATGRRPVRSSTARPTCRPRQTLARDLAAMRVSRTRASTAWPTHVEIGLTDELDALRYVVGEPRAPARPRGRRTCSPWSPTFGAAPGRTAPDPSRAIPELRRATVVSVGRGARRPAAQGDTPWAAAPAACSPSSRSRSRAAGRRRREPLPEAGRGPGLALRGPRLRPVPRARGRDVAHRRQRRDRDARRRSKRVPAISTPATFVAGVFGDGIGEPRFRQPVPAPDWLGLRLKIGGMRLTLSNGEVLDHERVLDMRHGVVYRFWRQRDGAGRTLAVRTARFASLDDRSGHGDPRRGRAGGLRRSRSSGRGSSA